MDPLKLRGSADSTSSEVSQYVLDAKERLRRLANRTSAPLAALAPIATHLGAVAPIPDPNPPISSPASVREANDSAPEPAEASSGGLDNLRAVVVDRAVDRLVDRLLHQWEHGGPPENRLDEHIVDRLVERLVSKLETGS